MTHTLNTAGTVAVATDTYWQPITDQTPRNVKVQCINKHSGVAQICTLFTNEKYFSHWAPLPRWRPE